MQKYLDRTLEKEIVKSLKNYPVTAILGPRQCGKSTLAKYIVSSVEDSLILDMESPSDLNKLTDPEFFFSNNQDKLICIDEIQRVPDLFSVIRVIVDRNRVNGRFLILGSASQDLIQQSSESLAGRISLHELWPFQLMELSDTKVGLSDLWLRGGYPDSVLKDDEAESLNWRENFIRTFLERDIPQFGLKLMSTTMRRFWTMLAHNQGQLLNTSKLGASLGVSHVTIRRYIDILESTFMVRTLQPFHKNIKKRLVKTPKVYIRDSGLLHALLDIDNMNELFGHPVVGASWEGFALEAIVNMFSDWKSYFYRTSSGEEIDLILQKKNRTIAIELKVSTSPRLSKGIYNTLEVINADQCLVVTPIDEPYQLNPKIRVSNLQDAFNYIANVSFKDNNDIRSLRQNKLERKGLY